jgi:hypothetical protein
MRWWRNHCHRRRPRTHAYAIAEPIFGEYLDVDGWFNSCRSARRVRRAGNPRRGEYSGNLFLFGGQAAPSPAQDNFFNDLWKFNGNQWAWISGYSSVNHAGVYGSLGVAAPGNVPGARTEAVSFTDTSGNLWLFGGLGLDSNGNSEFLNDLWKFSGGQWTWMSGSKVGIQNQPGTYGTKGVAAATNVPGERSLATGWSDAAGNFWLFGGSGWDSTGALGDLNDLWEFSGGQWTWVAGSNLANQPGTYGIKGTPAADNTPGSRFEPTNWIDASGNLWLLGGQAGTNSFVIMNDLWKFSGGQWTWMSGATAPEQPGTYGTPGIAAASNTPGSRVAGAAWTDAAGNLWLFGGNGLDGAGSIAVMNDLWKFNGSEWAWMGGAKLGSPRGSYGTPGTPASSNMPGGRLDAAVWRDAQGNVWLFGGDGQDANGTIGHLNDLWKLQP